MLCFSIVLWLRWLGKSAPKNGRVRRTCCPKCDKICTTPARENDLEAKIVKNWHGRSTFGSSSRPNLHHACARERFGNQNRSKLRASGDFWKLKSPKVCTTPARESDLEVKVVKNWHGRSTFGSSSRQNLHHACARTIWNPKPLKHQGLGTFFEVQSWFKMLFVWQAQGLRHSILIKIAKKC